MPDIYYWLRVSGLPVWGTVNDQPKTRDLGADTMISEHHGLKGGSLAFCRRSKSSRRRRLHVPRPAIARRQQKWRRLIIE